MTTLDVESVSSRLIIRKLSFLRRKLSHNAVGVGAKTMKSLVDGVDSLCLIKECRDLESIYGTRYTDEIMTDAEGFSVRVKRKDLLIRKKV